MIKTETRFGVAAALASVLMLAGCVFLIDTDKLQEGSGGTGGDAGQAGVGGSGGDSGLPESGQDASDAGGTGGSKPDAEPDADAAPGCTDDFPCLDDDPCTVDTCILATGECTHSPHVGIGLTNVDMYGSTDFVVTVQPAVDRIGMPVLTTDGESFWLGYWYEVGTGGAAQRDVVIKRYAAEPSLAPDEANLKNSLFQLDDVYSSPALVVRDFKVLGDAGIAKRLGVIVGGHIPGAGSGMFVRILDSNNLTLAGTTAIPEMIASGFDPAEYPNPESSAPAAITMDDHMVITFVYGKDLYTWDGRLAGGAFGNAVAHNVPNDVLNAVPIQGTNLLAGDGDFGAVLEIAKPGNIYSTDLWTHGNDATLKNLDPNSGPRLGIAAAPFLDPPNSLSVVAWSYETSNGPMMAAGGAMCSPGQCNVAAFPGDSGDSGEAMYPATSSSTLDAFPSTRAVGVTQVLHTREGATSGPAYSAVLATVMSLEQTDAGITEGRINPPFLLVRGPVESPSNAVADSPYGRTAVAISKSGTMMVAWIEFENGKMALRARRYGSTMCN